jgi:hypothetical protein
MHPTGRSSRSKFSKHDRWNEAETRIAPARLLSCLFFLASVIPPQCLQPAFDFRSEGQRPMRFGLSRVSKEWSRKMFSKNSRLQRIKQIDAAVLWR